MTQDARPMVSVTASPPSSETVFMESVCERLRDTRIPETVRDLSAESVLARDDIQRLFDRAHAQDAEIKSLKVGQESAWLSLLDTLEVARIHQEEIRDLKAMMILQIKEVESLRRDLNKATAPADFR